MAIVLKFYFEFDHASKRTVIYTAEGVLWGYAVYDDANQHRTLIYQGATLKMYFAFSPSQRKSLIYTADGTLWGEAIFDNSTKLTMIHKDGAVVGWTEHKPKPGGQKEGEVYLDEALFPPPLINLIRNPSFETGTDAEWEPVNDPPTWEVQSAIKHAGNYALKIGDTYAKGTQQTGIPLVLDASYQFKGYVYIGAETIPFGISWYLSWGNGYGENCGGSKYGIYEQWLEISGEFVEPVGGDAGKFGIILEEYEGTNFMVIDDFTLYKVS